jgi:hypothetical protein
MLVVSTFNTSCSKIVECDGSQGVIARRTHYFCCFCALAFELGEFVYNLSTNTREVWAVEIQWLKA